MQFVLTLSRTSNYADEINMRKKEFIMNSIY